MERPTAVLPVQSEDHSSATDSVLSYVQPDGTRMDGDASTTPGLASTLRSYAQALDSARLCEAYKAMSLTRCLDREGTNLQRWGKLALWVPSLGQEAAQIGAMLACDPQDYIFPSYREHAMALYRGVRPEELLSPFRGLTHGGWDARGLKFHLYTLVLAAQTLHAVGYAQGIQRDQRKGGPAEAVLACFGDGSSSEGDVHEAMVFAASSRAPVVFFCQNNHWAISVPSKVQSRVPLADRAKGYGFPGLRVDGNDLLAVYAATRWAFDQAKSGNGPVLIEAVTYRLGAHTTADDPTKYRTEAEERLWWERDPLRRLELLLRQEHHADENFFAQIQGEEQIFVEQLRKALESNPPQDFQKFFDLVYAQRHPLVEEERAWFSRYRASFEPATQGHAGEEE